MKKNLLALFIFCAFQGNAQVILNNSFESWEEAEPGWEIPTDYITSDIEYQTLDLMTEGSVAETSHPISVEKVTPGQSGTYAVKLKNVIGTITATFPVNFTGNLDTVPGTIMPVNAEGVGLGITERIGTFSGYYKFTQGAPGGSQTLDTALIMVAVTKWNEQTEEPDSIGGGFITIYQNASGFTAFNINLMYADATTIPDTVYFFMASSFTQKRFPGTELIVDNLSFTGITGNKIPLFAKSVQVYPNPATEQMHIKNLPESASHIQVRDYTGKIRSITPVSSGSANVITYELVTGVYFYSILDAEGVVLYSDKFNVVN